MKKLIGAFFLIFVACLVVPTLVAGDPGITISGDTSFGPVTIGTSRTTTITITIVPSVPVPVYIINNIIIIGSPDFSITSAHHCTSVGCFPLGLPIKDLPLPFTPPDIPPEYLAIDITYTPSSIGDATDTLIQIVYFDGFQNTITVPLSGTGVSPPVEGPLFSNVLGILPMAILAGVLVVLRRRRKITPTN